MLPLRIPEACSETSGQLNNVVMRWLAMPCCLVGGPTLGPLIGGAICVSHLRWRWTQYITGIFQMFVLVLDVIIVDESYPNALLVKKAQRLRHESGNWALHAKHEEWDVSLTEMANKYLIRPFQLLTTPICFLVALYASFCYGILYASLGAFSNRVRGSPRLESGRWRLAFHCNADWHLYRRPLECVQQPLLSQALESEQLPSSSRSSPTSHDGRESLLRRRLVHFRVDEQQRCPLGLQPVIGVTLQGIGFFTIFQGALNYLVDTFQRYAASAVAANTFLRSGFAGAFPLFIAPMLHNLGIGWGVSHLCILCNCFDTNPLSVLYFRETDQGERLLVEGECDRLRKLLPGIYSVITICIDALGAIVRNRYDTNI